MLDGSVGWGCRCRRQRGSLRSGRRDIRLGLVLRRFGYLLIVSDRAGCHCQHFYAVLALSVLVIGTLNRASDTSAEMPPPSDRSWQLSRHIASAIAQHAGPARRCAPRATNAPRGIGPTRTGVDSPRPRPALVNRSLDRAPSSLAPLHIVTRNPYRAL